MSPAHTRAGRQTFVTSDAGSIPQVGKSTAAANVNTKGSAEWPLGMCRAFSTVAVEEWSSRLLAAAGLLREGREPREPKPAARTPTKEETAVPEGRPTLLWVDRR